MGKLLQFTTKIGYQRVEKGLKRMMIQKICNNIFLSEKRIKNDKKL